MNRPRSTALGFLLALTLGLVSGQLSAAAGNGSPGSTQPTNGLPQAIVPIPSPTLSDLGRSLRNYFTEDELDLLFEYMRDSVIAAFKGEEVTLPPDLSFKLEILLVRMKKEGGHYMDNLIKQLEKDLERNLKEKLKEKLAPPDTSTSTYTPPQPQWTFPAFTPPTATIPVYPTYPMYPQYQPPSPPIFSYPRPAPPVDP
jgi:hypothetical protein